MAGNLSGLNFNAAEVPPPSDGDYEPIPDGTYECMVMEAEMKATRSGGEMLSVRLDVIDGQYQNRRIYDNMNIVCPNSPKAEEIAHKMLGSLCRAVGIMAPEDTSQFLDKAIRVRTGIEPAKPYTDANGVQQPGRARNKVREYMPLGEADALAAPSAPAAGPKRPWEK